MRDLRVLFIGNSHTYVNSVPAIFADFAKADGVNVSVTMIAHGGWYLDQHIKEPDVPFNIKYGKYDYVVLQEYAHPFGPEEKYFSAARVLNEWIREAGSLPVIYQTWAQKTEEPVQERMNKAHKQIADEIGALLAPVGENWWKSIHEHPETDLYYTDGQHASPAGSALAARVIWETIKKAEE